MIACDRTRKRQTKSPREWSRGLSMKFLQSPRTSGHQADDRVSLDQVARLVEMVVDDRSGIDADAVINRRQQFGGMHGGFDRRGARGVRFAVDESALDP